MRQGVTRGCDAADKQRSRGKAPGCAFHGLRRQRDYFLGGVWGEDCPGLGWVWAGPGEPGLLPGVPGVCGLGFAGDDGFVGLPAMRLSPNGTGLDGAGAECRSPPCPHSSGGSPAYAVLGRGCARKRRLRAINEEHGDVPQTKAQTQQARGRGNMGTERHHAGPGKRPVKEPREGCQKQPGLHSTVVHPPLLRSLRIDEGAQKSRVGRQEKGRMTN